MVASREYECQLCAVGFDKMHPIINWFLGRIKQEGCTRDLKHEYLNTTAGPRRLKLTVKLVKAEQFECYHKF